MPLGAHQPGEPRQRRQPAGRRRRYFCSRHLPLLAFALLAAASDAPPPLCVGDAWPEASAAALESGEALPLVQCWRTPACVRHTYLTRARCEARPLDTHWAPADDAPDSPTARFVAQQEARDGNASSFAALAARFLVNRTVLFTGDSISEGIWDFMLCQAAREGLHPTIATQDGRAARRHPELAARLDAFFARSSAGPWVGGRSGGAPSDVRLLPKLGVILARKGSSAYNRTDMASQLALADVLVLNYGLHYAFVTDAQKTEYAADMGALFVQLQAASSGGTKTVLFRETAAQHYAGSGAYTSWQQAHPSSNITACACAEMRPEVAKANIVTGYNDAVASAHTAAMAADVRLQPFYALTAARHDGHEASYCSFVQRHVSHGCCDCSHMCYTPQLARAIVAGMYAALKGSNVDSWPPQPDGDRNTSSSHNTPLA